MKTFGLSLAVFLAFDWIWLGVIMKDYNLRALQHLARTRDGAWDVWMPAALFTYVVMALSLTVFVNPGQRTPLEAGLFGALLGFCVYGIFDGTNAAILKDYPLTFAAIDITWGTLLFATAAVICQRFA